MCECHLGWRCLVTVSTAKNVCCSVTAAAVFWCVILVGYLMGEAWCDVAALSEAGFVSGVQLVVRCASEL